MKQKDTTFMSALSNDELKEFVLSLGEPEYRARQIQSWVYRKLASSFEEMTDLPERLRDKLQRKARVQSLTPMEMATSKDGTVKALFGLADGKSVESVLMPYETDEQVHYTICVSTQVGCPIGCPFCATGQQKFERNLTAGEIIDQVLYFARYLKSQGEPVNRIDNLVFMGMGEPLANYDNLWRAVEVLNNKERFGLGARHMTISSAGMVPQIKRLTREKLQVGLAISLHAAENRLRDRLVPLNRRYPLEKLLPVCKEYCERTGRRLSFEYILFEGLNDTPAQARSLARLLKDMNCHVNLIPANLTAGSDFKPPTHESILAFENELKRLGVACTLRQKKGVDIEAGCGQLRSRFLREAVVKDSPAVKRKDAH